MFLGLLSLALLGTATPVPQTDPHLAVLDHALARSGAPVLAAGHAPVERQHLPRGFLYVEDNTDEEGVRKVEPPAGLVPLAPALPHPVRAPQLRRARACHPSVTPLIYTLCTLLL